jgi:hypothetical protein
MHRSGIVIISDIFGTGMRSEVVSMFWKCFTISMNLSGIPRYRDEEDLTKIYLKFLSVLSLLHELVKSYRDYLARPSSLIFACTPALVILPINQHDARRSRHYQS